VHSPRPVLVSIERFQFDGLTTQLRDGERILNDLENLSSITTILSPDGAGGAHWFYGQQVPSHASLCLSMYVRRVAYFSLYAPISAVLYASTFLAKAQMHGRLRIVRRLLVPRTEICNDRDLGLLVVSHPQGLGDYAEQ
jgi:hypothetical protein